MAQPVTRDDSKELAWEKFIETQSIQDNIPAFIAHSWQRSWSRVNLAQGLQISRLNPEHFMAAQLASFDLISIAQPVMEDAYQYVEHSNTVILLSNGAGYVLELLGDREMVEKLKALGIEQGAFLAEERIGTNAVGLALIEQTPVQVIGAEHYCRELHDLVGAAAPIFDLTGRSLGAVGLFTPVENYHPHSLGLVAAVARAVEGQRQSDNLLAEQNSQLAQLNAILSSITDGIAVWNVDHRLIQVNAAASELLGLPIPSLMGRQVEQLFSTPPFLAQAIRAHESLSDVEVSIALNEHTVNCIASLYFVFHKKNELQWGIITLRPEEEVRKLVQSQVGANAALTLDDIPGDSVQMQRVRSFVRSAADATASILIRGEVGTGKNALANAIHNASQRREGPFVIFACSSIPNELVINELLGYEESIGAIRLGSRPSKFELAQAGTLFFQDVDALPLEAQAVLLNVLELGIVQRMGSQRPIEVDVRVVASTSSKMETLISQGIFRADLYYRLSTFAITIPPLRERHGDIPLVVDRVVKRLSRQLGHSLILGEGVIDLLKRYPWPGNVREIEATLGRAAIQVGASGVIEITHLPNSIRFVNHLPPGEQTIPNIQSLDEVEREVILQTAQLCRGNVTQMAHALGVSRTTLWRRLKVLQISPRDYR
ncbi:MAG TPA: dihydroxyacetone kinase operon transcriptional regulator DhaR [Anaerolineales bacterium]|nr:dihydroxyacetone kinase operon transcriptional regulator DhaR [Anaerolineales bacterium]